MPIGKNRGMRYIFVELKKFTKEVGKIVDPKDSWCYLLKNSDRMTKEECEELSRKGRDMGEAVKHLWNLSQDEWTQEYLEAEEKQRRDKVGQLAWAKKQGLQEGIDSSIEIDSINV